MMTPLLSPGMISTTFLQSFDARLELIDLRFALSNELLLLQEEFDGRRYLFVLGSRRHLLALIKFR